VSMDCTNGKGMQMIFLNPIQFTWPYQLAHLLAPEAVLGANILLGCPGASRISRVLNKYLHSLSNFNKSLESNLLSIWQIGGENKIRSLAQMKISKQKKLKIKKA
jgi:hypothetical protein